METAFNIQHTYGCECTKCSGTPNQTIDAAIFVAGKNVFHMTEVVYQKGQWFVMYKVWYMSDGRTDKGSMTLTEWNNNVEKWMSEYKLDHIVTIDVE